MGTVKTNIITPNDGESLNLISGPGGYVYVNGEIIVGSGSVIIGPDGATGPTGPSGVTGATGLNGLKGDTGEQGVPGIDGITSPAGLTWSGTWSGTQSYNKNYVVGYASASWWSKFDIPGKPFPLTPNSEPNTDTSNWALLATQGPVGQQGIQGPTGPVGPTGAGLQGIQGIQGPTGSSGVSDETSYEVEGGTSLTQPEFTGDPLFTASYIRIGNLVHFKIQVDMDNITDFGTGQYYMTLPFNAKYPYTFRDGCLQDIDANRNYNITAQVGTSSNVIELFTTENTSNRIYDFPFEQGDPITLTTSDNFYISGNYICID